MSVTEAGPGSDSPPFTGVGVALVTLFDARGELDAPATADLAARLVELGVGAVVVAGSTGEAAALSAAERAELLAAVRAAVTGVPVIAGTGAPSARQAGRLTAAAADGGADAVLVLSPPGAADPRPYYDVVAGAARGVPVIAYHFPQLAPPGIPVKLLDDLPAVACKDSSGDPARFVEALATYGGPYYPGSSALLLMAGALGCPGAIDVLANCAPERSVAAFAGHAEAQLALASDFRAVMDDFPGEVKRLTAERFGTSAVTRLG